MVRWSKEDLLGWILAPRRSLAKTEDLLLPEEADLVVREAVLESQLMQKARLSSSKEIEQSFKRPNNLLTRFVSQSCQNH